MQFIKNSRFSERIRCISRFGIYWCTWNDI